MRTLALAFTALSAACVAPAPIPAPLPPLPSARQRAWHELEYYAIVHFNMNTFTGREWGEGRESPDVFQPSALDCRQWARVARDAGMKGIILTAKHHDGFCLWPTKVTRHSVAASSWRDGKGDVLRELSDACREFDLKLGVYLSPWDRNNPHYGDSPRYNDDFVAQLEEVLSNYGPIFEVWFDGACGEGPNGKRQEYDWPRFVATVRRLQPDAVIFSDVGPDVRWIGNEAGIAGETCWSMLSPGGFEPGLGAPAQSVLNTGLEQGTHWIPGECDVSIRPGWYYHAEQDGSVKSLEHLLELWSASVGRNSNLLLNLPVDRRGLVHENDAARLIELRNALDRLYDDDLARGSRATASELRGNAARSAAGAQNDGDPRSFWAAAEGQTSATLALEFARPTLVDRVVLGEAYELGQRVRRFSLSARSGGQRTLLANGSTIGRKRILEFAPLEVEALELCIDDARACPTLASFEAYCAPPKVRARTAASVFLESTTVELSADQPQCEIRYTLDGTPPTELSSVYREPFVVTQTANLCAVAVRDGRESVTPERVALRRETLRPAIHFLRAPDPGLTLELFEGGWQSLVDLASATPLATLTAEELSLDLRPRDEHFALVFRGYVRIAHDGIHLFASHSDDGSRVYVDGQLLADNDGLHGLQSRSGSIGLAAGFHELRVEYFNASGARAFDVTWAGPGISEGPIPANALAH
ncbi:MAG: alpha-L-fucosidase [Planctomycetes bacterium]|nr:alpha-L-fucosidase [Planctomycetota bacterium]